MDIKSKSISYRTGTKAIAAVLIWLCFLGAIGSGIFLLDNGEVLRTESYYETNGFRYRFEGLIYNTIQANIRFKSIESIKSSGEDKNAIERNIEAFYSMKDQISRSVNFIYYIENLKTGEKITNISASDPKALIEKQTVKVNSRQWNSLNRRGIYLSEADRALVGAAYDFYAAVQEPLKQGDDFYEGFSDYSRDKGIASYAYMVLIASLVILTACAIYLAFVVGRREKGGEIVLLAVDRIYTDVHTLLVFIAAALSLLIVGNTFQPEEIISWIVLGFVLSLDAAIGISYVSSMIRQLKAGRIISNTLIMAFARLCFRAKTFKASLLLMLLGYGVVNGILFAVGTHIRDDYQIPIVFSMFLAFNAAAVYFSAKSLSSLEHIMKAAKEISRGNLDNPLDSREISAAFADMAEDIRNIQGGMKKAVAEAVKGERMKTDLIANVSHDLKTPLTSIVNYVDLLKREDLNNKTAGEYVGILEEKSARLKQLIDDLIEASKASSGNLTVNAEKVDLNELVMQACGEYEEKIRNAQLDIRINAGEKNTYVYADGKQMWRIIENLLSNAVKYSMPQTRVYVNIEKDSEFGSLTIKNISAYPLDLPPEQLTERFVRGDVSRTTEGSGLGLSIAQSLTSLQGGRFNIDIDGDLFKVNISVPLYSEDKSSVG